MQRYLGFGEFRLDVASRRLSTADGYIDLSWRAFEMLRLLAEAGGEIVTRDTLFTALWPDVAVEETSLTKVATQLRRTLQAVDPGVAYVETVPRRGYRLAMTVELFGEPKATSAKKTSRRPSWSAAAAVLLAVVASGIWAWKPAAAVDPADGAFQEGWLRMRRSTVETRVQSSQYFQQAITLNPNHARAYAALALANLNGPDPTVVRQAALRAVELDPGCGLCQAALGFMEGFRFHRWREAERRYLMAAAREPGTSLIWVWRAQQLAITGHLDEALEASERAIRTDSYLARARQMKASILYFQGRYEDAIAAAKEAASLDESTGWEWRSKSEFQLGRDEQALNSLCQHRPEWRALWPEIGLHMAEQGLQAALGVLLDSTKGRERVGNYPCWRATWHMQLGDPERAVEDLEAGLDLEPPPFNLIYLAVDPQFQGLRTSPRFARILQRVGLATTRAPLTSKVFE